jgi:hypothetical protein
LLKYFNVQKKIFRGMEGAWGFAVDSERFKRRKHLRNIL